MADAPLGYYNPNLRKQGEKSRKLAAERSAEKTASRDPLTHGFVSGLMGEDYGSSPISVLDPKRAKSQKAQDVGMAVGTALNVLPALQATKVPQTVTKGALKAVNDAHLYGEGFLAPLTPQVRNIVRNEKGGNWWPGSIERNLTGDIKKSVLNETGLQNLEARQGREVVEAYKEQSKKDYAINRWIDKKLHKYVQNEMGSPEDPIRKMAEEGKPLHVGAENLPMEYDSFQSGEPMNIISTNPVARQWESTVDSQLGKPKPASEWKEVWPRSRIGAPEWLHNLPDETPILNVERMGGAPRLGFDHLVDELHNAMDPNSGLPAALRFTPEQLDKITVPQAVERVAKINEWREQQRLELSKELARNPATEVVKEYPDNNPKGLHWVELRAPKTGERIDDGFGNLSAPGYAELEQALRYEGDAMGHCVGGYCDPVFQKRQRIFSLRDKDGEPHVTIEMQPAGSEKIGDIKAGTAKTWEIHQVKGKGNGKPKDDYIPYVQDFVKSQGVNVKRDLNNTELVKTPEGYKTYSEIDKQYRVFDDLAHEWVSPIEHAKDYFGKDWEKEKATYMTGLGEQISSGSGYVQKATPYTQETLSAAEREANLKNFLDPSVEKGYWYHGTAEDVPYFDPSRSLEKPGQAEAVFVSNTPKLPEKFAKDSIDYMKQSPDKYLTAEQKQRALEDAKKYFKDTYSSDELTAGHADQMIKSLESGNPEGEALDELHNAYKNYLPSGPNIMKLHVQVRNPFDPKVPEHVEKLRQLNPDLPFDEIGRTSVMETPEVQKAIKDAQFDAFYTSEDGARNLGIFDPNRVKSATGNVGTYDTSNRYINKKAGGSVKRSRYSRSNAQR